MTYDYAQYQADRARLLYRSGRALPVPEALHMKLTLALKNAKPEDHEAIRAAFDRLMAAAIAEVFPEPPQAPAGPDAAPADDGPPAAPDRTAKRPGRAGKAKAAAPPDPDRTYGPHETAEVWQAALTARAERHARRRGNWPNVPLPTIQGAAPDNATRSGSSAK